MSLNRRTLIAGLGTLPLAVRLDAWPGNGNCFPDEPDVVPTKQPKVIVYFHGLFLLKVETRTIRAYAVNVDSQHVYCAGLGLGKELERSDYWLEGPVGNVKFKPNDSKYPVLSSSDLANSHSYFRVELPKPDGIQPLRCFKRDKGDLYMGSKRPDEVSSVPMLLAFFYYESNDLVLRKSDSSEFGKYSLSDPPLHFHFRAEPPKGSHPNQKSGNHVDPMERLRGLVGYSPQELDLSAKYDKCRGIPYSLKYFTCEQQRSYHELNTNANCTRLKAAAPEWPMTIRPVDCKAWVME